jgi:DNA-binding transcriptional MerR regulator
MRVEMQAFSVAEACELTGLSRRELSCWDRRGLPFPDYVFQERRVYSFRDLLVLRALALLRADYSLQAVREVSVELAEHCGKAQLARIGVYRTPTGLRVRGADEAAPPGSAKLLDLGVVARELLVAIAQESSTRS